MKIKETATETYCCKTYYLPSSMRLCGHLWLNTSLYLHISHPSASASLPTRSKTVRCAQVLLLLEVISSSFRIGEEEEGKAGDGRTSLRIGAGSLTSRHTPRLVSVTGGLRLNLAVASNERSFLHSIPHYTYKMTFIRFNEAA